MQIHQVKVDYTPRQTTSIHFTCDCCGLGSDSLTNWPTGEGNINSTIIKMEVGQVERDGGGYVKETSFHLCPICFERELVPWMKEKFGEPTIQEHNS